MDKQIKEQALYPLLMVLLTVFGLSFAWEFVIEEWFLLKFFNLTEVESEAAHWEYVVTASVFTFLALLYPLFSLCRLITREKLAKENERQFKDIADNASATIFIKDLEGKYVFINSQYEKTCKVTASQVLGKTDREIFSKEIADQFTANDSRVLESLKPYDYEETADFGDGVRYYLSTKFPLLNSEGKAYALCGISTDITERKHAEEQIRIRVRQQAVTSEFGLFALGRNGIQEIMDQAVRLAAETLNVEYAKVLELLPEGDELLLRAGVGWNEGLVGKTIVSGGRASQAGFTFASKNPVVVEDLRAETRFSGPPLLQDHGVVSGMSVVIQGKEKPFGVFGVHTSKCCLFSDDDVNFLQSMANILAQGIDHQKTHEELRKSREWFKNIFEASNDMIFIVDIETQKIIDTNPRACEALGYSRPELLSLGVADLHPQDLPKTMEFIQSIREKGSGWTDDLACLKKSGELMFCEVSASLISINKSSCMLASIRDITERKKAQEQIQILSQAVEQVNASVVITDEKGDIEYVNPFFTKLTGYSFEEILGKNPRILQSGETQEGEYEKLWETLIAGETWRGEFHNKKKDGELYWESATISAIKNKSGQITHFIGVKEDVTERKNAEEKIRVLSQAIEQSPTAIVITDNDGIIQYTNPFFTKMTGYSAEEMLGENNRLLQSGFTPIEQYEELWETILSGKTWRGLFQNKKKSGELYWESAIIFPIKTAAGEITHLVGIEIDVTDRKKAEKALQNAEKQLIASEKLSGVGRLSAGVSHEILNPLNIISLHVQMLQKTHKENPALLETLDKIKNEIGRISKINKSLLTFARAGGSQSRKFGLHEEIENVLSLIRKDLTVSNIKLVQEYDEKSVEVMADPDELRQVLMNLINNARQAMPKGGKLTIAARIHKLNAIDCVEMRVSDTGCGIDEEHMDKIFEPFFTTKAVGEGTGMGLSVCHTLIEKNGGTIRVESEKGQGATFIIDLPLA